MNFIFEIFSKINIHNSMLVQALATCKALIVYTVFFWYPPSTYPGLVPKWKLVHEQARGSCKFSLDKSNFLFCTEKGGGAEVKTPCGYDRIQCLYDNGQVSFKRRALPVGKKILPLPEVRILKSESKVLIGSDASLTFVYNRRYLKLTFPSEIYVLCNVTLKLEPKCSMDF